MQFDDSTLRGGKRIKHPGHVFVGGSLPEVVTEAQQPLLRLQQQDALAKKESAEAELSLSFKEEVRDGRHEL